MDILDFVSGQAPKAQRESSLAPAFPVEGSVAPGDVLASEVLNASVYIQKQEQLDVLTEFMERAQYGHQAALPMICKGEKCVLITACPIKQAGLDLPLKKHCPVERAAIKMWVNRMMATLDIDPSDPEYAVDLDMVYELAGYELLRFRMAHHLSDSPKLFEEKIVGYSPQGQPIYDEKPSPALMAMEKYSKMVNRIRESLIATRKSQAQIGHLVGDMSTRSANIQQKAAKIAEARRLGKNITDADFEVKDE